MINTRAAGDARHILTGKDGAFYNEDGVMLATVETFNVPVTVTNTKYTPLGDAQEHEAFASYSVSLTMTQVVIEDDAFIQEFMKGLQTGQMPSWNFQGVLKGRNGSEQRIIYRDCIPSGQVDLQNVTTGEAIKRAWNFYVNRPPELQKMLSI
jgi:hypothetical protein